MPHTPRILLYRHSLRALALSGTVRVDLGFAQLFRSRLLEAEAVETAKVVEDVRYDAHHALELGVAVYVVPDVHTERNILTQ